MNYAPIVWDTLMEAIDNPYGVAGLIGNLYAESGLNPLNLQGSFESKLGYTDGSYTQAVDEGTYHKFITDGAGYGLAQWTYSTRKSNLLDFAREQQKSIGDLDMQLAFMIEEMQEAYPKVWKTLCEAKTIREASNYVLFHYEQPKDQSEKMQDKRAEYGQWYYDKYANQEDTKVAKTIDYNKYINSKDIHYLSNSGGDEKNNIYGGQAGDQTGKEWELRKWYNRPWTQMYRYEKNDKVGRTLAELGIKAALNNNIGYDQYQRTTYWKQLQNVGYDPSAITIPCEADCSAGAAANIKACGYLLDIDGLKHVDANMTSRTTIAQLKKAGFTMYTDKKYLKETKYLKPGDILLYENHHVSTNITYGSAAETQVPTPVYDIIGIATAQVNMHYREQANISASSLGIIKKGTIVDVIEILDNGWYKIQYKGNIGYTSNVDSQYWTYTSKEKKIIKYDTIVQYDANLCGNYKLYNATALNLRKGPGKEYEILKIVGTDSVFTCEGYYTMSKDNVQWLYLTHNTGLDCFASSKFLQKT